MSTTSKKKPLLWCSLEHVTYCFLVDSALVVDAEQYGFDVERFDAGGVQLDELVRLDGETVLRLQCQCLPAALVQRRRDVINALTPRVCVKLSWT